MVLEMVSGDPQMTVRQALQVVVESLASKQNIHIEMPWSAPDEILCKLLITALLQVGIIGPTPLS